MKRNWACLILLSTLLTQSNGQTTGLGSPCVTKNNAPGTCSPPVECLKTLTNLEEFKSSVCDSGDGSVALCCPDQITSRINPNFGAANDIKPLPRTSQADIIENVELPVISSTAVQGASLTGEIAIQGRANLERNLRSQGIFINSGTSEAAHQAFFGNNRRAVEVARDGFKFLEASKKLAEDLQLNARQGSNGLKRVSVEGTNLRCPQVPTCNSNAKYRTADGSCNNLNNPLWGKSFAAFDRILKPDYPDGINLPRGASDGGPLPSSRLISSIVAIDGDAPNRDFTHLMMQFGQFLDHDLTLLAITKADGDLRIRCCGDELDRNPDLRHPECFQIPVPRNDPFYSQFNENCMEFVRSAAAPPNDCKLGPRQQINQLTSYVDASMIYGSTEEEAEELRLHKDGRLKITRFRNRELLPLDKVNLDECNRQRSDQFCFKAGDERVNEQIDLTVMHIIWLREHNRIVKVLKGLNPHWDDEKLYQEGRKIIGAMFQHITYNEFLPLLLGFNVLKIFDILPRTQGYSNQYDPNIKPTVFNAFGAAAFRYGHTLVQSKFNTVAAGGKLVGSLRVSDTFNNPFRLYQSNVMDNLLRGLSSQPAQSFDSFVTPELTNQLFKQPGSNFGLDLVALNIQRARDHGIPSYNEYRQICGLNRIRDFKDLYKYLRSDAARRIESVGYRSVNDIDLFIGGVSEKPFPGSVLGPTFACLIGGQFAKLRHGDRFFYDNGGANQQFTEAQLAQIRKANLARVNCDNGDNMTHMQPIPFLQAGVWNSRTTCDSRRIPKMDFSAWKEQPTNTGGKDFIREEDDIDEGFKNIRWDQL